MYRNCTVCPCTACPWRWKKKSQLALPLSPCQLFLNQSVFLPVWPGHCRSSPIACMIVPVVPGTRPLLLPWAAGARCPCYREVIACSVVSSKVWGEQIVCVCVCRPLHTSLCQMCGLWVCSFITFARQGVCMQFLHFCQMVCTCIFSSCQGFCVFLCLCNSLLCARWGLCACSFLT